MKRWLIVFVGVCLLLPVTGWASGAKLFIKKGDKQYRGRANLAKAEKAVDYYKKALAADAANVVAKWKLARVFYWLGNHTSGKAKRMELYKKGIKFAQEAVDKDPKCVPCHFWLGVSYGKYGEAKGIMSSLDLVPNVKKEMNTVLKLKETYEFGGCHRVLGRLYFKLPGAVGGDKEKAVKHLKKAVEIGPKNLMNHRFLAEVYLATGKKDEAKKLLDYMIGLPKKDWLRSKKPETKEEQELAEKLLKKHF